MTEKLTTGIPGLDEVLEGGLLPQRAYLVRGGPGCGKTTLGLHFVAAAGAGEPALFVTLGEPAEQIRADAASMGIDVSKVEFLDLSPSSTLFAEAQGYDLFSPAEVERSPTARRIVEAIEASRPVRVFVDCMTHFRYLSADAFQFRRQTLSFLRYLRERGATVLFTSEHSEEAPDADLQFLADGVIALDRSREGHRTLTVEKYRGARCLPGPHDVRLEERGLEVFPLREPGEVAELPPVARPVPTGCEALDRLLGGGIEPGAITMLTGPPGVGKTALGMQLLCAAAERGFPAALYTFEEIAELVVRRAEALGQPAGRLLSEGRLHVERVEPLRYTPQEFARRVEAQADGGARIVMIDSTAGYRLAIRDEQPTVHLHRLCKSLQTRGIGVVLVTETTNVTGDFKPTRADLSYLADNLVFLRYLEIRGEMKKAIGVLKKRFSDFEKALREFEVTGEGLKLGPPLEHLRGILTGTPTWSYDGPRP